MKQNLKNKQHHATKQILVPTINLHAMMGGILKHQRHATGGTVGFYHGILNRETILFVDLPSLIDQVKFDWGLGVPMPHSTSLSTNSSLLEFL